tara:strand:+ start:1360 stop:1710 length:351 start_codon:yes stop_codon:yes gene_type:complete
MQIKQGNFCPLLQKECIGLECAWLTQVRGTNPNTGKEVDEWECAVKWMPMLLIENSQMQRQTGAAVESFRNVVAKNPINLLVPTQVVPEELPPRIIPEELPPTGETGNLPTISGKG